MARTLPFTTDACHELSCSRRILPPTKTVIEINGGTMMRFIRVDYTVKPEVDLDGLKATIYEFVAGIRSHHPEHRYTSFQHPADPYRFIHIGEFVEEALPDLQKQPFFLNFTEYLPGQCSVGPEVSRLDRVASTAAQALVPSMAQ
jgi:hypothetical protein